LRGSAVTFPCGSGLVLAARLTNYGCAYGDVFYGFFFVSLYSLLYSGNLGIGIANYKIFLIKDRHNISAHISISDTYKTELYLNFPLATRQSAN